MDPAGLNSMFTFPPIVPCSLTCGRSSLPPMTRELSVLMRPAVSFKVSAVYEMPTFLLKARDHISYDGGAVDFATSSSKAYF